MHNNSYYCQHLHCFAVFFLLLCTDFSSLFLLAPHAHGQTYIHVNVFSYICTPTPMHNLCACVYILQQILFALPTRNRLSPILAGQTRQQARQLMKNMRIKKNSAAHTHTHTRKHTHAYTERQRENTHTYTIYPIDVCTYNVYVFSFLFVCFKFNFFFSKIARRLAGSTGCCNFVICNARSAQLCFAFPLSNIRVRFCSRTTHYDYETHWVFVDNCAYRYYRYYPKCYC